MFKQYRVSVGKLFSVSAVAVIHRRQLCSDTAFFSDTYDYIVCVGALTENHVEDSSFPELIRITKSGQYLM